MQQLPVHTCHALLYAEQLTVIVKDGDFNLRVHQRHVSVTNRNPQVHSEDAVVLGNVVFSYHQVKVDSGGSAVQDNDRWTDDIITCK